MQATIFVFGSDHYAKNDSLIPPVLNLVDKRVRSAQTLRQKLVRSQHQHHHGNASDQPVVKPLELTALSTCRLQTVGVGDRPSFLYLSALVGMLASCITPNENRLITLHQAQRESLAPEAAQPTSRTGLTSDVKGDGPFGLDLGCYAVSCCQFRY